MTLSDYPLYFLTLNKLTLYKACLEHVNVFLHVCLLQMALVSSVVVKLVHSYPWRYFD